MTTSGSDEGLVSVSGTGPGAGGFGPGGLVPGSSGMGGVQGFGNGTSRIDHPEKLSSAGDEATQLAGRAKAMGDLPKDTTDAAARSLDGEAWGGQLGSALKYLSNRWASQSRALSGKCQTVGQRCTATAKAYTNADTESKNTINSVVSSAHAEAVRKDFG